MKKIISALMAVIMSIIAIMCCGCEKTTGLSEDYNTPNMNFKGLNFECVTDNDTANRVRNQMVYFDFPEFVIEDLESKGNKINSIDVIEANADIFHESQTIASILVDIDAESGDIKSGEYYIAAYFTYDSSNDNDVKMYFMNYCFVPTSDVDQSLFEECYEKVKNKAKS